MDDDLIQFFCRARTIFSEQFFPLIKDFSCGNGMRTVGGSFNGRTTDSDSVNRGSNPRLPANGN